MVHVVTGPPCAGKSTYVSQHSAPGDLIIDYDKIARAMGAVRDHDAEGVVKQAAFNAREGAIKIALDNPAAESWVIHSSMTKEQEEAYKAADAEIVELDPGYDECMARAMRDDRPQRQIDAIDAWYHGKKGRQMNLTKNFKANVDDSGTITGYFSTYDRIPDSYGDVIAPGAFTETIKAREESGHPFPLCWNHSLDVDDIIGVVDSVEDMEKGPMMTAHFFDTDRAQRARDLVKSGAVYQFSFAYHTRDEGAVELEDGTKANELRKLDLFEVSVVPIPANQNAVVTEVKSGRRNSAKDADKLRQIIQLAQECLGELDDTEAPEEAADEPEAKPAGEEQREALEARKGALLETIEHMQKEEK